MTWPAYELGPLLRAWRGKRFSAARMADVFGLHVDHYLDVEHRRQPPPTFSTGDYEALAAFIASEDDEWGGAAVRERLRILEELRERDRKLWTKLPGDFWDGVAAQSAASVKLSAERRS